jgi:large subunit ribosomal protein L5
VRIGAVVASTQTHTYTPRLKERYLTELRERLRGELGLSNVMQVPRPEKVVVNMGVGDAARDAKIMDGAIKDLSTITGQKPAVRRARRSIATFKIRQGMPIGAAVTIRGDRMWDFLDRLLSVVLPRIRDFRGLDPKAFDGGGNYTLGVTEQLVFPEVDYDDIDATRGMNITIVTTARNDDEGRALLTALGFPFAQVER